MRGLMIKKHRIDQKNMDKTLDDILRYLKSVIRIEDQEYIQYLHPVDIFFYCYGDNLPDLHNYTEPTLFLQKLRTDGFVNQKDAENEFQINLSGIQFINNGGYRSRTYKKRWKGLYNFLKYFAVFLNAVALLFFAYDGWKGDKDNSKSQSKNYSNKQRYYLPAVGHDKVTEIRNDTLRNSYPQDLAYP